MSWARLDDMFYDHEKVIALLDHDEGLAAVGLWTLVLGWAKKHADPRCPGDAGRIPASLPRRLGGNSELAKLLVAVGLWTATEDGWAIHDFAYWQDLDGWAARSEKAANAARIRWNGTSGSGRASSQDSHAPSMPGAMPGAMQPQCQPHLTTPNRTRPLKDPPEEPLRGSSSSGFASRKPDATADRPGDRDDVERLCRHLADRIQENYGKRPAVTVRWRRAARLMLDRDGRPEARVHAAIDWCQDDEFWHSNIRSMEKLRAHYERLREAAARRANRGPAADHRQQATDEKFARALERARARDAQEAGHDPRGDSRSQQVRPVVLPPAEDGRLHAGCLA